MNNHEFNGSEIGVCPRFSSACRLMPRHLLLSLLCLCASAADLRFEMRAVADGLRGGYQITAVDLNKDGKLDLIALASGMDELVWFENPKWERHVLARGLHGMINAASYDIKGDGIPEIALAHEFNMTAAKSIGIVSLLECKGDPREPWSIREIDRITTSHRLRWADIDGSGHKVLINAPLTGANAAPPDFRDHVPLVFYRPGEWKREIAGDQNEGVMHGIYPVDWDGKRREAVLTASFSGIDLYRFEAGGRWTREEIAKGDPAPWPKGGTSDIAVGRLGRERYLAAVEPWHGNNIVVYRKHGREWMRSIIDDALPDSHSIATADFDGDGRDEIVVAERGKPGRVVVYSNEKDAWKRTVVDEGITAASCAVADLNGDHRPDIACIGSGTQNLKWYENLGAAK